MRPVHARVGHQRLADLIAAGQQVDDAVGQARVAQAFVQLQPGERRPACSA